MPNKRLNGFQLHGHITLIIFYLLFILSVKSEQPTKNYQQDKCQYRSQNYSLEWAFEPVSNNVVFVLKAKAPTQFSKESIAEAEEDLTPVYILDYSVGIGFEKRNNDSLVDFIEVSVNQNQTSIIDGTLNNLGEMQTDSVINVQILSIATLEKQHQIVAKFSRDLLSKDTQEDVSLEDCITFKIPLETTLINSKKYYKSFKNIEVCNIKKFCTINVESLNNKETLKPRGLSKLTSAEVNLDYKSPKALSAPTVSSKDAVEIAHSVDVSGIGDPCSFVGPNHYYTVNWSYNKGSDCVDFIMRHPIKKGKWWSAVGIGDNMSDMDIGIIFLENGKAKKMNDYFSNSYATPDKDDEQDWVLHNSKSKIFKMKWLEDKEEDVVELQFSRPIETNDKEKDRTLSGCVLFQFAANLGAYGPNYAVRKHQDWPDLYKACELKERCVQEKSHQKRENNIENEKPKAFEISTNIDLESNDTSIVISRDEKDNIEKLLTEESTPITPTINNTDYSTTTPVLEESSTTNEIISELESNGTSESTTLETPIPTISTNDVLMDISDPTTVLSLIGDFNGTESDDELENSTQLAEVSTTELNVDNATNTEIEIEKNSGEEIQNLTTKNNEQTTTLASLIQGLSDLLKAKNATITELSEPVLNKNISIISKNETLNTTTTTEATTPLIIATTLSTLKLESKQEILELNTTKSTDLTDQDRNDSTVGFTVQEANFTEIKVFTTKLPTTEITRKLDEVLNTDIPLEHNTILVTTQKNPTIKQQETTLQIATTLQSNVIDTKVTLENQQNSTFPTPTSTTTMLEVITAGKELEVNITSTTFSKLNPEIIDETRNNKIDNIQSTENPTTKDGMELTGSCDEQKRDLEVCDEYMANYFQQVKQWADKHNEPMENQFGKACKLLSAVPHVPTFCCQIFQEKCQNHL